MDLPSLLSGLAADLRVESDTRGVLAARPDLVEALVAAGFGPADEPHALPAVAMGKRPLVELGIGAERYLVRRFHHGGLLRWLTGDRFDSPRRPFDEWRLQRRLVAAGVLAPEVVAVRAVRARPWGWRLALLTRRIAGALDLGEVLSRRRDGRVDDAAWHRLLRASGCLIAELHRIGFLHADLTPRNLMVEEASLSGGAVRLWVIDLDGSSFHPALGAPARRANLQRLARHLERMGREHGLALSAADSWRFLCAYAPERAARARLARDLDRDPVGLHRRLGWTLERWLGRGRSGAERQLGSHHQGP